MTHLEFLNRETRNLEDPDGKRRRYLSVIGVLVWENRAFSKGKGWPCRVAFGSMIWQGASTSKSTGAHGAMIDDFNTAQIFQLLIPAFSKAGLRSAEDLVRVTKNFKGGDAGGFRYEDSAVSWSAIKNVSPMTGKRHARELRGITREPRGKGFQCLAPASRP